MGCVGELVVGRQKANGGERERERERDLSVPSIRREKVVKTAKSEKTKTPDAFFGATEYGVGVDFWSAGCILAELFAGKSILTGRTEVEQLHRIFKLCGSPLEEYWKKWKLPHATISKSQQSYKRCIKETFKDFPSSSLPLIVTLLAIDPIDRLIVSSLQRSLMLVIHLAFRNIHRVRRWMLSGVMKKLEGYELLVKLRPML
ncbi:hypothetical protein ACP275_11G084800 [Erythranthe tilingii]